MEFRRVLFRLARQHRPQTPPPARKSRRKHSQGPQRPRHPVTSQNKNQAQKNSPHEVRGFLGTNHRAAAWPGGILFFFAMFGLLAFAARLSGELRDAGRRWEIHASLVVSSAVVYGSVTLLATAVDVGVVYRIPDAQPAADAMALFDVAAIAHFLSVAVLAVMSVAAAHVALAPRVLPRWPAWLGLVPGAAVLAGTVLLPRTTAPMHYAAPPLLTWITAVSIVLASRRSADETISGTTPHAET